MRVGLVILPEHRWADAAPRWRRAQEWGFDHAWTYDHLAWRSLADGPWFGTVPTLTAAALVTSTIRLGTFVASPNFRHPVTFAKDLMTLDDISGGRFTLGVGAGGSGYDATVLGAEPPTPRVRVDRFGEFVELLDLLLRQPVTTWRGEHYAAVDARMIPGGPQAPRLPFVVAANGPRALRVAATHGQGWLTNGPYDSADDEEAWWRGVATTSARFDEVLAATDREGPAPDRYLSVDTGSVLALSSVEHLRDVLGRAGALGFTDVVIHWPRPDGVYAGDERVLERVAVDVLPALTR